MKAVWVTRFGPVDGATVTEAPDPAPGPGQILINVVATDANYPARGNETSGFDR